MNSTLATTKSEFAKNAKLESVPECPACSCKKGFVVAMARVYECGACHGLHGHTTLGDSYSYVLPHFTSEDATERQRYFDFTCVSSKGMVRRHGWFDPKSRLITQVG